MRYGVLLFLAGLACVPAAAQNHVYGYAGGASSGGAIYFLDGQNVLTSMTIGGSGVYGLVMDRTNDLLMATNTAGFIVSVDPKTRTVLGTLTSGLASPRDITVDHNGDYFVTSTTVLWKVDALGNITTLTTGLPSLSYGGMDIDINTGDLLVQNWSGTDPLLRITRDGQTVVTMASGGDTRYGMSQDKRTGDVYSSACCGDQVGADTVWVVKQGSNQAVIFFASPVAPVGCYSLRMDRGSAASPQLILGGFHTSAPRGPGGFFTLDLGTKIVTRLTTINTSLYDTETIHRRNVTSLATGRGTWDVIVNVPEDAARPYVLGVSASGTVPGLPLPDGRHIALRIDDVTIAGLTTGFGPFLTPVAGNLSATGKATAKLDFSSFGSGLNGLGLWFLAMTFDPSAPSGIKTVTDPHVLIIEGL